MTKISLDKSSFSAIKGSSSEQKQTGKYTILNPQALQEKLYNSLNKIGCPFDAPVCPDWCYSDNCDC